MKVRSAPVRARPSVRRGARTRRFQGERRIPAPDGSETASADQGKGKSASTATSNPGGSSRAIPPVRTRVSIASLVPRL